ncbi:uncharacterized protein VP01_8445g1, partial [Puccinia sorghi]
FLPDQPFNGTCGGVAEAFVGQIGLHAITYPKRFPTNASKVAFTVSFMKDYAATWSQPFFDQNRWHHAEVALLNLRQTGTVLGYKQDFNQQALPVVWANNLLMSLYQHGLKEKIQLAVVMSNVEFDSLRCGKKNRLSR